MLSCSLLVQNISIRPVLHPPFVPVLVDVVVVAVVFIAIVVVVIVVSTTAVIVVLDVSIVGAVIQSSCSGTSYCENVGESVISNIC